MNLYLSNPETSYQFSNLIHYHFFIDLDEDNLILHTSLTFKTSLIKKELRSALKQILNIEIMTNRSHLWNIRVSDLVQNAFIITI